jgi:hypothetical protein
LTSLCSFFAKFHRIQKLGAHTYDHSWRETASFLTENTCFQNLLPVPDFLKAGNAKLECGHGGSAVDESKDHLARFLANGSEARSRETLASFKFKDWPHDL